MNKRLEQSPKEWNKVPIGSMAKSQAGGTPSTLIESYWGGTIPWMSSGELNKKQVYNTEEYITDSGLQNSSAKIIPKHSVLIGLAGQGKTRGTVAMNYIPLATNQSVAAIFPSKEFDPWFLYHNLNLRYHEIRGMSAGEGGRGGLNLNIINSILVLLPPLQEQKAIARVLSNADQLILATEELIEKKKKIKKSLMQELLTGKTRLPGFSGEWEENTIENLCDLKSGNSKSKDIWGQYWVVDMGSVTRDSQFIVTRKTNDSSNMLKAGEIIMPKDDIGGGNIIGRTGLIEKDNTYVLSDHVYVLRVYDKTSLCPNFLNLAINSDDVNRSLRSKASGSAQLGLARQSVLEQEVIYPQDIEEQKAIARVLSGADQEIGLLEEKLVKYKKIKQGMMQELLTGKTRLPEFRR